ncbi:MAG TPA: phosphoenolpyruvate-utilizing N-terminal domain-containing protein [Symbiobacteriaceae bacterium]|nr:phosphoenolpyruvate-utilizing N-terminal domain-containing protein [Symbiobacteriaceae bacterium]
MQTVVGAGCWPGRAEGTVVWLGGDRGEAGGSGGGTADRAGEVLLFRAALGQAVADLERWAERQSTLEGRVLLQGYKEALLEDAWSRRACALIDGDGLTADAAAAEAARTVAAVLGRSPDLRDRKEHLETAARWLAGRLAPFVMPPDAVVAAEALSPVELLDLGGRPALVADATEPPVVGDGPVIWGVPQLGPHWAGRRVALNGAKVTLDVPAPRWWTLDHDQINGIPVCYVNGDMEAIGRMARKVGRPPIALVRRLDDLAAVPLFARDTAGVALDLDRLGPAPKLKHPGVQLLLRRALEATREAGLPLLAGGEPAAKHPDTWLAFGFTALYGAGHHRGGAQHAIRGDAQGGL